jgi:Tol biopolymer transport system component
MSSKILTNEILLTLKSFSYYRYSPESQKILYLTSQRDLKENKSFNELYIMNIDGTELKLISEPKINIEEPQFILQGKKIVYIQNNGIYIMNIDGTSKKKISENNKINNDIEGFLFDENLTKIIIIKLIKVPGLQVKKGNDAYPDCDKATNCYIADDLCYTHWDSLKDKIKRPFIYNIKYDKDKDDIIIDENSEINLLEKYTFECPSHYFGIQDEFCFNKTGDKIYFILKRFTGREYVVSTNCDLFEYSFGKDELLNICKGVYENINNLKINIYEDINFCLSFKNQQNKIQENVMKIYGEKTFYKKDKNGKIDFNLGYNNYPKLSPNNKLICWLGMERDGYESDINKLYIYIILIQKKNIV